MSTNLDFTEYSYHKPVMLEECMDSLAVKQGGIYIDCTLGGGGHTKGKRGILLNFYCFSIKGSIY